MGENNMKLLISSAILVTLALNSCSVENKNSQQKPNILFIFADDWGWGDLACHGHPYLKTPNLDKLAAEGTEFYQFTVASGVCSPSRTAVITGHFPARYNIDGELDTDFGGGGMFLAFGVVCALLEAGRVMHTLYEQQLHAEALAAKKELEDLHAASLRDAGDGSAGPDCSHHDIDTPIGVVPDLFRGRTAMDLGIGRVLGRVVIAVAGDQPGPTGGRPAGLLAVRRRLGRRGIARGQSSTSHADPAVDRRRKS